MPFCGMGEGRTGRKGMEERLRDSGESRYW